MVWNNQQELEDARRQSINTDPDRTLFGAAKGHVPGDEHGPFWSNEKLLRTLVSDNRITGDQAREYKEAVEQGSTIPIDPKSFRTALFYSSLPETYGYEDIARLLAKTRQLLDPNKIDQRLRETGQIIFDILEGLRNDSGEGLHLAFVQLGIRHEKLDKAHGKIPGTDIGTSIRYINQVGLAYTLLTFSYTPFASFRRAGKPVPNDNQQEKWLAMWNVVGSLMGIKKGGLPESPAKADEMLQAILASDPYKNRTREGEDAGHNLMKALVKLKKDKKEKFCKWSGEELMRHLGFSCP